MWRFAWAIVRTWSHIIDRPIHGNVDSQQAALAPWSDQKGIISHRMRLACRPLGRSRGVVPHEEAVSWESAQCGAGHAGSGNLDSSIEKGMQ